VKNGLPDVPSTIRTIMESDVAQWCAPWRRQQAGRRDSSPDWKAAESGPNPKKKIRQIESARRIFGQSYIKKY
jgi:hypothetical protein